MDYTGILSQKLQGSEPELEIVAKIGNNELAIPATQKLETLVNATVLDTLEDIASTKLSNYAFGTAEYRQYGVILKGLAKIRAAIPTEETPSAEGMDRAYPNAIHKAIEEFSPWIDLNLSPDEAKKVRTELEEKWEKLALVSYSPNPDTKEIFNKGHEIILRIAAIKEDKVGRTHLPKGEFTIKQINAGKAKQVFESESLPGVVFYRAVTPDKVAEIRKEVAICKQIRANLFQNCIKEALADSGLTSLGIEILAVHLNEKYSSINELVNVLKRAPEEVSEFLTAKLGSDAAVGIKAVTLLATDSLPILMNHINDGAHLATDLEELKVDQQQYTVWTEKAAGGDADKFIRLRPIDFKLMVKFGFEFLTGMKDLHYAGHVQGDNKPDNIFVYEKSVKDEKTGKVKKEYHIKISDWGKATTSTEEKDNFYSGNPRFAPPEMRRSQKGEVYSSAVILIRMLEEAVLDGKEDEMVVNKEAFDKKSGSAPKEGRRGIEKYLCSNAHCIQQEVTGFFGSVKVYGGALLKSSEAKKLQRGEREIQRYIGALIQEFKTNPATKGTITPADLDALQTLLFKMTKSDPAKRPTMADVQAEYQRIMSNLVSG